MTNFVSNFNKMSLQDIASVDETSFPELTPEEKALNSQFITLSSRFDELESLIILNDNLKTKTFCVGHKPSKSDLVAFQSVLPIAKKWTDADSMAKFRHILRWADLIQNTLVQVGEDEKLTIDHDISIPREVKEKKKAPAGGAEASAASAASNKDSKSPAPAPPSGKKDGQPLTEEKKKAKAEAQKAKKAAKAKAKAEQQAKQQNAGVGAAAAAAPKTPALIDFRVGFIEKAIKHPNADSLYVSTIDLGDEEGPRTICSGLVNDVPLEEMQQRYVVCVANLKPVTMRGVKSCGMVLCASQDSTIELVIPPPGSKAGDRLFFDGYTGTPEKVLNPKKKIWEAFQPKFSTNDDLEVTYTEEGKEAKKLINADGKSFKSKTLAHAHVS